MHGQQNIIFTTYRVQTVEQYAIIRSINDGLVCNFVHSDDTCILFNILMSAKQKVLLDEESVTYFQIIY
jgi:hypothetical protein